MRQSSYNTIFKVNRCAKVVFSYKHRQAYSFGIQSLSKFYLLIIYSSFKSQMQISPHHSQDLNTKIPSDQQSYLLNLKKQTDLIAMYLNQEVFYHPPQQICENNQFQQEKSQEKNQNILSHSLQTTPQERQMPKHKKSVFHNFQKHLISLIKKYINLVKDKGMSCEDRDIAHQIWQAFMKTNSSNKRLLYMVFGVEGEKASKSVDKIFNDFEEFKQIRGRYDYESITRGQRIIRQNFVYQTSHLSKSFIKSNSSISKFDQFYEYYLAFIREIQMGQMSMRMSKTTKANLLQKLKFKGSIYQKE